MTKRTNGRQMPERKSIIKKLLLLRRVTRLSDGKRVWLSGLNGKEYETLYDASLDLPKENEK